MLKWILVVAMGLSAQESNWVRFDPKTGKAQSTEKEVAPGELDGWNQQKDFVLLYPESRMGNKGPVPLISFLDHPASYRSLLTRGGIKFDRDFKRSRENFMAKYVAVVVEDRRVMVWWSQDLPPKGQPNWVLAGDFDERRIKGPWWKRTLRISLRVGMMMMGGHMVGRFMPGKAESDIHFH